MTSEQLKGHLDPLVLAILEQGPAHGYAIIESLRERSGGAFDLPEGTIYPALHRLERAGTLRSAAGKGACIASRRKAASCYANGARTGITSPPRWTKCFA